MDDDQTYDVVNWSGLGYGWKEQPVTGFDIDDAGTTLRDRVNDRRGHDEEPGDTVTLDCGCVFIWDHNVDTRDGVHIVSLDPVEFCPADDPYDPDWREYASEYGEYWVITEQREDEQ